MRNSPNRVVGLAVGGGFLVFGVLGFFINPLLTVSVNPLQNALHLAIGAALIVCALVGGAPRCNAILGTLLLAVGIAGLFIISSDFNVLGVNGAANLLHFASAACLLAAGLGARR
jgi:hypothetical protein